MAGLKSALRKMARLRGVPQARHVAERAVAPYLRADVHSLNLDHVSLVQRIENLERVLADTDARISSQIAGMAHAIDEIERHQPAVLNAITSVNGTVRILRREFEAVAQLADTSSQASALMLGFQELKQTTLRLAVEVERAFEHASEAHQSIEGVYGHIKRIEQDTATGDANVLKEITPHLDTL